MKSGGLYTYELKNFPHEEYVSENINGFFPDKVYIKTRTQTFNSYHYYILQDGHIWYKGIPGAEVPGPDLWTLFMETGLPHNKKRRNFAAPGKIVEISADADELVALSDAGRFYRICFDKIITRKKNYWYDAQGWPNEEPLVLNNRTAANIAWAMGKRNSHVRYYEDIFGNAHHYGTMEIATTYILLEDGQEICIGDTGLPSDFSHNLIGPERGTFKSVALSASASTMFLINETGEMYTRLADFDTIGSDPMFFKYTYTPYKSDLEGTDYRSNYSLWGLPSEEWLYQPKIPLTGKALLTRHITILQNGMGNAARELRVAGLNRDGVTGYWTKPVFGTEWIFVPAPLTFSESDFLAAQPTDTAAGTLRGTSADIRLEGFLWENNAIIPNWQFEIENFNILEGSCELIISRKEESCRIKLYPAELWTYYKRNIPGRDGTPKNFFVTIEIPDGAFDSVSEEFRQILNEYLLPEQHKLFSYIMEASTEYVILQKREKLQRNFSLFLTNGISPLVFPQFMRFINIADMEEMALYHSEYLKLSDGPAFGRDRYAEIREKISANKWLRDDIKQRIKSYENAQKNASRSLFAYSAFNVLTHITLLYRIDFPKIYTITRFGDTIMESNDANVDLITGTRIRIDKKLLEMIELRISAYETMEEALKKGAAQVYLPANFSETWLGYWEFAGLPIKLDGSFTLFSKQKDSAPAVLLSAPSESEYPGWVIIIGEEDVDVAILIELNKAYETIYKRANVPAPENPYVFDGYLFIAAGNFPEGEQSQYEETINKLSKPKGKAIKVHWNGEELSVRERSGRILFIGTANPLTDFDYEEASPD
ncbi:hypothetical protein K7I13_08990 [Brucepastera parasyntrophica]|uniref:hypothetical protein n=1 Tax=Brucepastera parasyntrophica TaxID=2880008 RepID=UPI00210BE61B|nr:hypothetical protein [Brucepastera parasyntrophica]ULQ58692.1 hypothetical protein K7I13_08990 [Brucepastera parasyntrophica]